MTFLSDEWFPDKDGVPHRQAARVVVISSDNKVLLIKGHDAHDLDHRWWFTIGGGIIPDESKSMAAVRELAEETGIVALPQELIGPVLYRESEFQFSNETVRQDEWFFLLRLPKEAAAVPLDAESWTELERKTLDRISWFSVDQLRDLSMDESVYPLGLPWWVERWMQKWDGVCQHSKEY